MTGPIDFTLVGVWSMNHRASQPVPQGLSRSQPIAAAELYDFQGERGRLAVVGDFNSAPQWDKPKRPKFANLIKRYSDVGLSSAYHRLTDEPFGTEQGPHTGGETARSTGLATTSTMRSTPTPGLSLRRSRSADSSNGSRWRAATTPR